MLIVYSTLLIIQIFNLLLKMRKNHLLIITLISNRNLYRDIKLYLTNNIHIKLRVGT